MASLMASERARKGTERVRDELLTALHFGKLSPGDQVPSVRRLADRTGMNRKTVHRAYRRLAQEGLLDVRPGSGTFVAEASTVARGAASVGDLLRAVNRVRASAEELGLAADHLASFLHVYLGDGLRGTRVAVAECNEEQLGLISSELQATLGLDVRPVLLSRLAADPASALRGTAGLVTTDCHRSEVTTVVEPLKLPVYRLALDPRFPRLLADRAREAPVVMVVRDCGFVSVFKRLLSQMAVPQDIIDRFTIVDARRVRSTLARASSDTLVCVSPVAPAVAAERVPDRFRRLNARWHIEPRSLDRLRAELAMDAVARNGQSASAIPS
jgi:DNA-binding transcriptional regulator YhcF (GntR family)